MNAHIIKAPLRAFNWFKSKDQSCKHFYESEKKQKFKKNSKIQNAVSLQLMDK